MNIKNIVSLFNEYKQRIKENIATCGNTAMSVRVDDTKMAFVKYTDDVKIKDADIEVYDTIKILDIKVAEMHRNIYDTYPEVNAVIHTHTPYAAAIGKIGINIPSVLDDAAQIIGINISSCDNDIDKILKVLKKRKGCIIKHNGTLTHGRSLDEAYTGCLVLEKSAKSFISACILGSYKKIPYFEAALMHFIYQKKYSKANQAMLQSKITNDNKEQAEKQVAFSDKEKALRQSVIDAGIKLLNSNLVQGTWGNISVRLDETYMLITPSGLDYLSLKLSDIVKFNFVTMEYEGNLKPSGEKDIHAMIYLSRKDVNVVIHSHPNEGSAYAASLQELPAINDEIKKYIKGSVKVANYGLPSTKKLAKNTVIAMEGRNACFMANHGMLSVGATMDEAFECSRILEESSGAYIDKKAADIYPEGNTSEEKRINAFYNIVNK